MRKRTEPVDRVDEALEDIQEGIDNPVLGGVSCVCVNVGQGSYGQPLSVVDLAGAEQRLERVVAGEDEASEVDEEGSSQVEEDEEEVDVVGGVLVAEDEDEVLDGSSSSLSSGSSSKARTGPGNGYTR